MNTTDWLAKILSEPVAIATLVLALVTAVLAGAAFWSIWQTRGFQRNERKRKILGEIRDWVLELRNISLEPITFENMTLREANISLKYGMAFNKVEYFEKIVFGVFKDTDFNAKLSQVTERVIAVAVLGQAVHWKTTVNARSFEAFIGYNKLKDELTEEYKQNLAELRVANESKDNKTIIDKTNDALWNKYVRELANSQSALLSKLVNIESGLV